MDSNHRSRDNWFTASPLCPLGYLPIKSKTKGGIRTRTPALTRHLVSPPLVGGGCGLWAQPQRQECLPFHHLNLGSIRRWDKPCLIPSADGESRTLTSLSPLRPERSTFAYYATSAYCADGGSRTHTPRRAEDFKSPSSSIPSHPLNFTSIVKVQKKTTPCFSGRS